MSERRQFPVEHRDDPRLVRMKHQVPHPKITVAERCFVAFRNMVRGAIRSAVRATDFHASSSYAIALSILRPVVRKSCRTCRSPPRPAAAQSTQCSLAIVPAIDAYIAARSSAWTPGKRVLGKYATLDPLHQIERGSEHITPGMEQDHCRHRHVTLSQRFHHPVLTVDGVRRWQQRPRWLLAQHERAVRKIDEIRWIRLTPTDARHVASARRVRGSRGAGRPRVSTNRIRLRRQRTIGTPATASARMLATSSVGLTRQMTHG